MSRRTLITTVVVAVIVLGTFGIWLVSRTGSNPAPAPNTTTPDTSGNQPSANGVTITYTDNGFTPPALTVKKGDMLRVVNQSPYELEFSSDDHPAHTDNPELNMSALQPGGSSTLLVTRTGTWGFHNHLKPDHDGTLTVTE